LDFFDFSLDLDLECFLLTCPSLEGVTFLKEDEEEEEEDDEEEEEEDVTFEFGGGGGGGALPF
jgi:hypothetical protein